MSEQVLDFFGDISQESKMWQKDVGMYQINQKSVLFQGEICRIDLNNKIMKKRYLVLLPNELLYLKDFNSQKVCAKMKIDWVKIEYKKELVDGITYYVFRLIKNHEFYDIYLQDLHQYNQWKIYFQQMFVQQDFHDKYTPIKMIGKGSFASVYLVQDKLSKQRYAVKAFSKYQLQNQKKGKESLIKEIQIMRNINHKNIMKLLEIHESQNSIYLVTELLEGGELFARINSRDKFSQKSIQNVIKCLLEAISYLEDKGIMHRDIKPENLILQNKGNLEQNILKIVDFGLAEFFDQEMYLFKKCGTPGYVAPEILNSSSRCNTKFTSKVDVFSAGIIFYILITGKSPFQTKNFERKIDLNAKCKIDFTNEAFSTNPLALDLLTQMLQANPQLRVSAKQALEHPYFNQSIDSNDEEEFCKFKSTDLKCNKEKNNSSIVSNDKCINGNTVTITQSESQKNKFSLNCEKDQSTRGNQRTSIFNKIQKNQQEILKQQLNFTNKFLIYNIVYFQQNFFIFYLL